MMMAWGYLRFFILLMLEGFVHPEQQLTIVDDLKKPTHHNNWFHLFSSIFILYHAVSSCFCKRIAQVNVGSGTSREFGYDSAGAPGERKRFCSRCRHSLKLCRSLQFWSCAVVNACPSTCQVTFGRRWNDMKLLLLFCGLFSSAKINPSNLFSITSHLWRLGWAQLVVCSIQITAPERYKICYCVWGCPSPWDRPEIYLSGYQSCGFQEESARDTSPQVVFQYPLFILPLPGWSMLTSCSVHQGLLSVSMRRTLQKRCM